MKIRHSYWVQNYTPIGANNIKNNVKRRNTKLDEYITTVTCNIHQFTKNI